MTQQSQDDVLRDLAVASQNSANTNRVPEGMVVGGLAMASPPVITAIGESDRKREAIVAVLDRHVLDLDFQIRAVPIDDLVRVCS